MGSIKSYKDLSVWQKSMDMVVVVYSMTKSLPHQEMYALSSQMQRSAVSVPSNIAEGFGRNHTKDFVRFLRVALGSSFELQTQLEICMRLNYIDSQQMDRCSVLCDEISKMLTGLINKLIIKVDSEK